MPDDSRLRLIRALGDTVDGLDVALCAFDDSDRTLAWNSAFFKFFPEYAGHVYVGEPYEANLRRFYTQRLDAQHRALHHGRGRAAPGTDPALQL